MGEWYLHVARDEADPFHVGLRASQPVDTSGVACAAILWMDLFQETKEDRWMSATRRALRYCLSVQFREVQDANLKGAFVESGAAAQRTDRSPFFVGTRRPYTSSRPPAGF